MVERLLTGDCLGDSSHLGVQRGPVGGNHGASRIWRTGPMVGAICGCNGLPGMVVRSHHCADNKTTSQGEDADDVGFFPSQLESVTSTGEEDILVHSWGSCWWLLTLSSSEWIRSLIYLLISLNKWELPGWPESEHIAPAVRLLHCCVCFLHCYAFKVFVQ